MHVPFAIIIISVAIIFASLEVKASSNELLQAEILIKQIRANVDPKLSDTNSKVDQVIGDLEELSRRTETLRAEITATRAQFDILNQEFTKESECFFEQKVPGMLWPNHPSANKEGCIAIDGIRHRSCPQRIQCGPGLESVQVNTSGNGCPVYECTGSFCPERPTCSKGQRLVSNAQPGSCPSYRCEVQRTCPSRPTCSGEIYTYRRAGCTRYVCITGNSCPPKPKCDKRNSETLVLTLRGSHVECLDWRCQSNFQPKKLPTTTTTTTSCAKKPSCKSGYELKMGSTSKDGCTSWTCSKKSCPSAPLCKDGEKLKIRNISKADCPQYTCERLEGSVTGAD